MELASNQISDISPVTSLTNLTHLSLDHNRISDLQPLIDNSGLATGDIVSLKSNLLSHIALELQIPALQARGVIVESNVLWSKDNAEMAYIPAGSFEMGDHLDNMSNALPVHTVKLDAFYMDKTEVTVGQFKEFVNQSGYDYPQAEWERVGPISPGDDYPMVYAS